MCIGIGWYLFQIFNVALLTNIPKRTSIKWWKVFKMLLNKNLSPNVGLEKKKIKWKVFQEKWEYFKRIFPFQKTIFTFQMAKSCTKRHVDRHTQVNPSCYLVLSFKVFPHIFQLELERIKTLKLQKTSPPKIDKRVH